MAEIANGCGTKWFNQVFFNSDKDGWATVSWDQMIQANELACERTNMGFIDRDQKKIDAWIDLLERQTMTRTHMLQWINNYVGKATTKLVAFAIIKFPETLWLNYRKKWLLFQIYVRKIQCIHLVRENLNVANFMCRRMPNATANQKSRSYVELHRRMDKN